MIRFVLGAKGSGLGALEIPSLQVSRAKKIVFESEGRRKKEAWNNMAEEINGAGLRISGIQALKDNTAEGTAIFTLHVGGSIGTKSYTREQLLDLAKRIGFNGLENLFTKQNLKDLDSFSLTGKKIVSDNLNDDHSILEALVAFFIDCKANGGVDNSKAEELLKTISSLPDKFSKMKHGDDQAAYVKTLDLKSLFEKAIGTEKDNFSNDSPNYQFSKGISEEMVKQSLGLDGTGQTGPKTRNLEPEQKKQEVIKLSESYYKLSEDWTTAYGGDGGRALKHVLLLKHFMSPDELIKFFYGNKLTPEMIQKLDNILGAYNGWLGWGKNENTKQALQDLASIFGDSVKKISPDYLKALMEQFAASETNGIYSPENMGKCLLNFDATVIKNCGAVKGESGNVLRADVFTSECVKEALKGYIGKIGKEGKYYFINGKDLPAEWTDHRCQQYLEKMGPLYEKYKKYCSDDNGNIDYRKMLACLLSDLKQHGVLDEKILNQFYKKESLFKRADNWVSELFKPQTGAENKIIRLLDSLPGILDRNNVSIAKAEYPFDIFSDRNGKATGVTNELRATWNSIDQDAQNKTPDTRPFDPVKQNVTDKDGIRSAGDIAAELLAPDKQKDTEAKLDKIISQAKEKLNNPEDQNKKQFYENIISKAEAAKNNQNELAELFCLIAGIDTRDFGIIAKPENAKRIIQGLKFFGENTKDKITLEELQKNMPHPVVQNVNGSKNLFQQLEGAPENGQNG